MGSAYKMKSMEALRLERIVGEDGMIRIEGLRPGESVEVIVLRSQEPPRLHERQSRLNGSLKKFDHPFEPVALEDWDLLK